MRYYVMTVNKFYDARVFLLIMIINWLCDLIVPIVQVIGISTDVKLMSNWCQFARCENCDFVYEHIIKEYYCFKSNQILVNGQNL